jgi:DNA-binding winged helix-turn-helix (wHTH) protein
MVLRFADFVLDGDRRLLLRGGEPVHLEPKAFELLTLLVSHSPKALSKSEIHEVMWPGTYVSESSLAGLIADLRTALGDDSSRPRFIRTVRGFGYAFCGTAVGDTHTGSDAPRSTFAAAWSGTLLADDMPFSGRIERALLPILPTLETAPGALALVGRTLVALGGAYLIRALTEMEALPARAGVALGLVYGLAWLALADRAGARGLGSRAVFDGLTSCLIVYPLLWEATTRFGLMPDVALTALAIVLGSELAVALRRQLATLAWIGVAMALGTACGLLAATRHLMAGVTALLAIAAMTEWLATRDRWTGLRWPVAITLDGGLLILVWLATRPGGLPAGYPAVSVADAVIAALAVPAIYWTSLSVRTLGRGWPVAPFEVLQGGASLAIALGGSWRMTAEPMAPALGAIGLVGGALSYAAAFAIVDRRQGSARSFHFYATVAGFMVLFGSWLALGRAPSLVLVWCALGLAAAAVGRRYDRTTLRFHGVMFLTAGAVASGLVVASWRALAAAGDWTLPSLAARAAWVSLAAGYGVLAVGRQAERRVRRVPQAIAAALLALCTAGLIVTALVMGTSPWGGAEAGVVATLRTGVLALLVIGLACGAGRWRLAELGWFVYPLLALGAVKLVTEDLGRGRPTTLFFSLVLYGGALILAPRVLRRGE